MGMYTNFALKFSIDKSHQDYDHILSVLAHIAGIDYREPAAIPDHSFFSTLRWDIMARSGRSFIDNQDDMSWVNIMLIGEFKNYDGEIDLFIDWISPYLCNSLVGYSNHEDSKCTVPYFVESAE